MKITLTNVEETHFRVISIKAGKVFVMTCKKGRVKGPAKSLSPSDASQLDTLFTSQVEQARKEGFSIEVDNTSIKAHSETVFFAEIPEYIWEDKALETFLAVDMFIPVDVTTKLEPIEGSDLHVRRNFTNYIVQGTLKSFQDSTGLDLTDIENHVRKIILNMAPLVVLSSKLIVSTDAAVDGVSDPSAFDPIQYIKANMALVPDSALELLADNGKLIKPADISKLAALSQDCTFCV